MRQVLSRVASALVVGILLAPASNAFAEDTQYSPPDVLLLIDSSGSMGRTTFRENATTWALPACGTWGTPKTVSIDATSAHDSGGTWTAPDRWSTLVKVLTGTVKGMACVSQSRSDLRFKQEFRLGVHPDTGEDPIDARNGGYHIPYNRIVARQDGVSCTPAPSWSDPVRQKLVSNALSWPTDDVGPIFWRKTGDFTYPQSSTSICPFSPQEEDGLIDRYREVARFGLMTFDTQEYWQDGATQRVGIGIVPSTKGANYIPGVLDTWSFFENWLSDAALIPTSSGSYHLPGCGPDGSASLWELGARNPAAPPWEGRLMTFGPQLATTSEIIANNDRVQQALLAVRPFGDTPVAAMLDDARVFLLKDGNNEPPYIGGKVDTSFKTQVGKGCRRRVVILLTDGGPTSELRPDCALAGGKCPYPKPQDTAETLKNNNIQTYVIGFSLSNGATTCKTLLTDPNACSAANLPPCDQTCPSAKCAFGYCLPSADKEQLATCCVMKTIAEKGGTTPYFTDSPGELKSAFDNIVNTVSMANESRTIPVFAAGVGQYTSGGGQIAAAEYFSSYRRVVNDLMAGTLERQRYVCESSGGKLDAILNPITDTKGDKLGALVDGPSSINDRTIYTAIGETLNDKILSERSIRPWYDASGAKNDGLGAYGVTAPTDTKLVTAPASTFAAQVPGAALLGATGTCSGTGCCFPTKNLPAPTANQCRDRFINLELGLAAGHSDIEFKRSSAFGAINKSTPIVVASPNDLLRDDSYTTFQRMFAKRPAVLYAATIDGQLHAFRADGLDTTRSELWAFIPPAVLPLLDEQFTQAYGASSKFLLDGPVVVRNVPGKVFDGTNGRFLTRTKSDSITPANVRWYSILVGSFGSYGGYYALDVSWPDPKTDPPMAGYAKGPRFLWQLTTDIDGLPLFGDRSATPTIGTLYFKASGDTEAAEHAVAILPGGMGGAPATKQQAGQTIYDSEAVLYTPLAPEPSTFIPKTSTRKWQAVSSDDSAVRKFNGARSLTIVRLDTGEVVRTLRFSAPSAPLDVADKLAPTGLYDTNRITKAQFHAPVSGRVITYPSQPGTVSDRAYVGDSGGRMWRLDLSSSEPADWAASMFFDAYPSAGPELDGLYTAQSEQPIQTPPIVSVDPLGRVTLAFSSGDQEDPYTPGGEQIIWSLTEQIDVINNKFKPKVNWYLNSGNARNPTDPVAVSRLKNGERVFGQMTLFNSNLYFTTYDPSSADAVECKAGASYLWGVHYINAGTQGDSLPSGKPEEGPIPTYDPTAEQKPALYKRYVQLSTGSIPFGVGVTQKPACYTTAAASEDPFLGFGAHTSISGSSAAVYQLVVQGGATQAGTTTKVTRTNLPPPSVAVLIDSWASIVD